MQLSGNMVGGEGCGGSPRQMFHKHDRNIFIPTPRRRIKNARKIFWHFKSIKIVDNSCELVLNVHNDMRKIYLVTGFYEDQKNTEISVLMIEGEDVLKSLDDLKLGDPDEDYYDESIYYYGVSEKDLQRAIENKESFDGFIPICYDIDGEIY